MSTPLERATDEFAGQLARWRTERGLSKRALAAQMGFDPSYVSHVEGRRHRPTEDFARRAENALDAGGAIWHSYSAYEAARALPSQRSATLEQDGWRPSSAGVVIEREDAALGLRDDVYHIAVRRRLHNVGTEPIVRYPVRIRVDRYPNNPQASARVHHAAPLTWSELGFSASAWPSDGPVAEPMTWRPSYDSDAVKELWLRFGNDDGQFAIDPGERMTVEYSYRVTAEKWGPWFARAIRVPTRELRVELDFPAESQPAVWGTVSSLSVEGAPLHTPIRASRDHQRAIYTWSVRDPSLQARYRFEWRLRG